MGIRSLNTLVKKYSPESISEKSFLAEKSKIVKNKTIDKMGAQTSY